MGHYNHLSTNEREITMVEREKGMSMRAIARMTGRSASSISRELRRNQTDAAGAIARVRRRSGILSAGRYAIGHAFFGRSCSGIH